MKLFILCKPLSIDKALLTKTLRIMKITAFILLSACLTASAKGYTQNITLSEKNAPLQKVFKEIKKQTGYNFLYTLEQLDQAGKVDVQLRNATLDEALAVCLEGKQLTYTIVEKTVVIKRKELVIAVGETPLPPPPIDVHGRIVNEKGEPVAGASVKVKGSNKGTSTNDNGEFTLIGIDNDATLVISAINIEQFEVKVNGRTDLTTLNARIRIVSSEGVTVEANTGYQKIKPNEAVGSIAVIDNELFNRNVSTDILSHLRGITPGLLMLDGSSSEAFPNAGSLGIRGYSTILGSKRPLIVLDNFPYEGDLSNINPNDIENVTVLKDAVAASIWGAKSGNGVIVITTKNGKYNQRPRVSFNTSVSIIDKPDLFYSPTLSSSDFIDIETYLFNQGLYNTNITSSSRPPLTPAVEILLKRRNGQISAADSASQLDRLRRIDIRNDLRKYYFNKPIRQQYAVSLSGGGANQIYFVSFGYDHNINNTGNYSRYSINANNTYSLINHHLEITTGILFAQTMAKNLGATYSFKYPYGQLADENGNPLPVSLLRQGYIDTAGAGKLLDWRYFPLNERDYADTKTSGINYLINAGVKYKISNSLNAELKYQYIRYQTEYWDHKSLNTYSTRDQINKLSSINWATGVVTRPVPLGGILDLANRVSNTQNIRGQLNFTRTWKKVHKLVAIGGAELSEAKMGFNSDRFYGYDDATGTSIPVDLVNGYRNYVTGGNERIPSSQSFSGTNTRFVSVFANAVYSYKDRYSVSMSARRDGANLFGASTNNKWKPLWSAGLMWEIDKESFYDFNLIPELKFRATYGFQGNIDPNSSSVLTMYYLTNTNDWNQLLAAIGNPPQPDLRWEKTGMLNLGLDFGLKNNRISGSFEYYRKKGIDLIGRQELAPSSGLSSWKGNSANMVGSGLDIIINTKNLIGKFQWSSTIIFSHAKDKVTLYKLPLSTIGYYIQGGTNPIEGRPVSALYSYRWAGLDPQTGDPQGYLNGQISKNYSQLLVSTDFKDMVYNGPGTPTYFGNLLNSLSYKSFSISFNIVYKLGYYFRRPSIDYNGLFTYTDRGSNDYQLRWKNPGDEKVTNVPSFIYPGNSNRDAFYRFSEVLVEKGDHIRFQDVKISYDFTKIKLKRLPFQSASLYIYASNLGILWKANKSGIDPDYGIQNEYTSGLPGKTISAGLKINF